MSTDNNKIIKAAINIGSWTAKQAYKGTKFTAKTIYNHRDEIAGAGIGIIRGSAEMAKNAYGHTIREKDFVEQLNILQRQSKRYQNLTSRYYGNKEKMLNPRRTLVDSIIIGVDFTGQYAFTGAVSTDVQQAYELAYPRLAESQTLIETINEMNNEQIQGIVAGIKGKLFEIQYAEYLNDGHLPTGFSAKLAETATNPGWDLSIVDDHGVISQELQLKATDSLEYIREAFERYPHIDVVTTDEVYSHIAMQGFSEHVINSGINDQDLTDIVNSSLADSTLTFDWMPSIIPFALIAYSVNRQNGLSSFQKGKQFGERSAKSYVAYLAGGAVAVATNTWWLGLLSAVGSRVLLGMGGNKLERLNDLKRCIANNERVLKRMEFRTRCDS